jgi:nitroreductase
MSSRAAGAQPHWQPFEEASMSSESVAEYGVLQAIYTRRAVRAYTSEPVSAVAVRELMDAAVHAPTAMHLEPWGFAVIQDKALLKRYSDRAKALLLEPPSKLAVGWGESARLARPQAGSERDLAMLQDPDFNIFYDAGTLIVVCRRTQGPFAYADCWLAAQNLMLEATARGLGTCVIGFAVPVLNTPEVLHELGIPADGAAVAPIIVGHPRGEAPVPRRKPPQVLRWLK